MHRLLRALHDGLAHVPPDTVDRAVIDAPDIHAWVPLAIGVCEKHNCCRRRDGCEWLHGVHLKETALDQELIVVRSGDVDGTTANDDTFLAPKSAEHR